MRFSIGRSLVCGKLSVKHFDFLIAEIYKTLLMCLYLLFICPKTQILQRFSQYN